MTVISDEAIAEIRALQARRDAGEFDWEENGDYTNGEACTIYKILNSREENPRNWVYKDSGWLGAYIIETDGCVSKQIDVTHVKKYIEDLLQENEQLKEEIKAMKELEDVTEDDIPWLRGECEDE